MGLHTQDHSFLSALGAKPRRYTGVSPSNSRIVLLLLAVVDNILILESMPFFDLNFDDPSRRILGKNLTTWSVGCSNRFFPRSYYTYSDHISRYFHFWDRKLTNLKLEIDPHRKQPGVSTDREHSQLTFFTSFYNPQCNESIGPPLGAKPAGSSSMPGTRYQYSGVIRLVTTLGEGVQGWMLRRAREEVELLILLLLIEAAQALFGPFAGSDLSCRVRQVSSHGPDGLGNVGPMEWSSCSFMSTLLLLLLLLSCCCCGLLGSEKARARPTNKIAEPVVATGAKPKKDFENCPFGTN